MSSNYNPIERSLAKVLSSFPWVKKAVKLTYQRINAVAYKKPYQYSSESNLHSVELGGETFFGYYDRSPESPDGNYLLLYKTNYSTKKLPNPNNPIELVLYDLISGKIIHTFQILSYNWQQGAKAQWLTSNKFIFNNYSKSNGYHSVIVEIQDDNLAEIRIDTPIYDCYKDAFGLSLSFERLNALRPDYGYRNNKNRKLLSYEKDGIFKIDFQKNKSHLMISLERLINFETKPEMVKAHHKVNHIMISPDGEHFIFLHRYLKHGKRFDRLFMSDKNGDHLQILADLEMISHCCWDGNNHIVGYLRDFGLGDNYYRINIQTLNKALIGNGMLDQFGDGHPTVKNGVMVSDTYPNKSRMKELYFMNLQQNTITKGGEFYESLQFYGETRCDLHPRFNYKGTRVYFDSVHEGFRKLYWINLNE